VTRYANTIKQVYGLDKDTQMDGMSMFRHERSALLKYSLHCIHLMTQWNKMWRYWLTCLKFMNDSLVYIQIIECFDQTLNRTSIDLTGIVILKIRKLHLVFLIIHVANTIPSIE